MGKSELFSYLSAFVTIVLAVALTDIIQSTHRLVRARRRIKWDARPLVLAALVAITVVSEFFSLWSTFDVKVISMGRLLWLLTVPTLFALLAYNALPDEIPEDGLDLSSFWDTEHRSWAVLWAVALVLDRVRSLDGVVARGGNLYGTWMTGLPMDVLLLASCAVIYFARRKPWSWVGVMLLTGAMIYGVQGWYIAVKSAAA